MENQYVIRTSKLEVLKLTRQHLTKTVKNERNNQKVMLILIKK